MDLKCPKCRESWDHDTLHEYAEEVGSTYREVGKLFRTKGCGVAFAEWQVACQPASRDWRSVSGVIYDLLGDDLDGASSLLEDAEFAGLI